MSATLVLLLSGTALAQAPAPAPDPVPPTQPPTTPEPGEPVAPPPADESQPAGAPVQDTPMAPAEVVEPKKDEKPPVSVVYDGGTKFTTADEKFELRLLFRNQLRYQLDKSLADGSQIENKFYINRVRFQVEGHLFGKDTRYKLEVGLGDQGSFSFIKDVFVDNRLGDSPAYLRFGQWKRPFNRAEIVSDFGSTFNERSIQNELAGGGRSFGAAVHNDYEKSPTGLEWVVGVFNTFSGGSDRPGIDTECEADVMGDITCDVGRPTTVPDDFAPAAVARVGFNSEKSKGYTESDLEGGPLRYALGASYKIDLADLDSDAFSHGVEVDANIKVNGFSITGGAVMMKLGDLDPAFGFYVQPALFVVPKKVEVAGRFAMNIISEEDEMTGAAIDLNEIEARGALNYYLQGHTYKLATDAGFTKVGGDIDGDPELQLRVMLQLSI